jgi:hypothetical protein
MSGFLLPWFACSLRRSQVRPARSARPCVEALEDRLVPAAPNKILLPPPPAVPGAARVVQSRPSAAPHRLHHLLPRGDHPGRELLSEKFGGPPAQVLDPPASRGRRRPRHTGRAGAAAAGTAAALSGGTFLLFAPGSVSPLGELSVDAIAPSATAFTGSYLDFGAQQAALIQGFISGQEVIFSGVLDEPLPNPFAALLTGFPPAPPNTSPVPLTGNILVQFVGTLTPGARPPGALQGQLTDSHGQQFVISR